MKTPALEQALAPLRELKRRASAKYEADMREFKITNVLAAQRMKLFEKRINKLLGEGKEQEARAEAEASLGSEFCGPVLRRYEVNDPTVAKLGELLRDNPNGLLLYRDELVGFFRSLEKDGNEEARSFYLESWNGTGSFTFDRIGRGTVTVESNTISLIGGIQPDVLAAYVRQAVSGGSAADGLLQRLQVAVWPDVSKEWRNVDRWPNTKARQVAFDVFDKLDRLDAESVAAQRSTPIPFLRFAPEAQERFVLWHAELEQRLRSGAEHPAFEGHLSKYRKLVPALALLLHLASGDKGPVSVNALTKACIWQDYLEAHARRIYFAALRSEALSARELARRIQRRGLPMTFKLRDLYRKGWAALGTKEEAESAVEMLCELGWIRPAEVAERSSGRPASPTFVVNPRIYDARGDELPKLTELTMGNCVGSVSPGTGVCQISGMAEGEVVIGDSNQEVIHV